MSDDKRPRTTGRAVREALTKVAGFARRRGTGMKGDKDNAGERDGKLYCSFCGRSQAEVKKLIAGPRVFICNGCIRLCSDLLDAEQLDVEERNREIPTDETVFAVDALRSALTQYASETRLVVRRLPQEKGTKEPDEA